MDQLTGVHVFEGFEELVNYKFFMDLFENARADDHMQICIEYRCTCLHEVKHQIKIFVIFCLYDVQQPDNVLVACIG